jgi:hypothetical protein
MVTTAAMVVVVLGAAAALRPAVTADAQAMVPQPAKATTVAARDEVGALSTRVYQQIAEAEGSGADVSSDLRRRT